MPRLRLYSLVALVSVLIAIGSQAWAAYPTEVELATVLLAFGLLLVCHTRLVLRFVRESTWHYSILGISAVTLAAALLCTNRRAPDALCWLTLFPITVLVGSWTKRIQPHPSSRIRCRRLLFPVVTACCLIAMALSIAILSYAEQRWAFYYDRPFEVPITTYLLMPAALTMMTLQHDLAARFAHPSIVAGIVVSLGVALLIGFAWSRFVSWLFFARSQISNQPRIGDN